MKLLTIGNPKIAKGIKLGYLTAVLHLAPFKASGYQVCPMAEQAGCWHGCLNTAGRGGISAGSKTYTPHGITLPDNAIQRARIERTRYYAEDRSGFMQQLSKEIELHIKRCNREGLKPAVRLNGTSDIQWERGHRVPRLSPGARQLIKSSPHATLKRTGSILTVSHPSVFAAFPEVQFYDYTKIYKRFDRPLPANYHLTLSYSTASKDYAAECVNTRIKHGASLAVVTSNYDATALRLEQACNTVVDGDAHDLRFTDPADCIVLLRAKGRAKHDTSGFVLDY